MTALANPRDTARRLGSQTLLVVLGNVFTLAVGLPLQIYVSRVLGASGVGIYGVMEAAIGSASGFLDFGLAQTSVRFVPEHVVRGEYASARRLIGFAALILASAGAVACAVSMLAFTRLEGLWPELAGPGHAVAIMAFLLPFGLLSYLFQQSLRGLHEIRYLTLGGMLQLAVKAALTVAAFAAGLGLFGYVLATVGASLAGLIWLGFVLKRKLAALPSQAAEQEPLPIREWRRFAAISYSNNLLGVATQYLDRFLLASFVGSAGVGVLVVVQQIQNFPAKFNQLLLIVGAPMFASAHAHNDPVERQKLYELMTDWTMKVSLPLIVFLLAFSVPILGLFGREFARDGTGALIVLTLGQLVNLACGPTGSIALMSGLEAALLRLSAINTGFLVLLIVSLAPPLGLLGVAIASAASTSFINVAVLALVRRRLGLCWRSRLFVGWLLPAFAASAVALGTRQLGLGTSALVLAAVLAAMYAASIGVILLQGLNEDEKGLVRYLADRILARKER